MKIALVLLALSASGAQAQQRSLDRADSLLVAGKLAEARTELAEWNKANPASKSIDSALRSRALYLNARLTNDGMQAQELYLTLALSYPTSREAPDALLRLGQSFFAAGESRRAIGYLERLVNDYPNSSSRGLGYVWLVRAQSAVGARTIACRIAGTARKTEDIADEARKLLESEESRACAVETKDSVTTPATRSTAPAAPPALPGAATSTVDTSTRIAAAPPRSTANTSARFALQTAAFREVKSAIAIANQLKRLGFDARVSYVEGSELARVRIGRFMTRAEANTELQRVKAANIDAIIVDDATRERTER